MTNSEWPHKPDTAPDNGSILSRGKEGLISISSLRLNSNTDIMICAQVLQNGIGSYLIIPTATLDYLGEYFKTSASGQIYKKS